MAPIVPNRDITKDQASVLYSYLRMYTDNYTYLENIDKMRKDALARGGITPSWSPFLKRKMRYHQTPKVRLAMFRFVLVAVVLVSIITYICYHS